MSTAAGERPLIGVLGGLGPAATLDFYGKVLSLTPAATDQQHVRLLIDADPEVPNRNESVAGSGPSSAPSLVAKALRLKAAGAEMLVMPCNAAHAYRAEIEAASGLPFISIVTEALAASTAAAPDAARVGLLGTSGTLRAGLYQRALQESGRTAVTLDEPALARFMAVIYRVKAGELANADLRREMLALAMELVADGAEVIIAACTEVPLLLGEPETKALSVPLVDATEALARAVVERGRSRDSSVDESS